MYLKLGTRQTKKLNVTQCTSYTEHDLNTVHRRDKMLGLGTVDRGAIGKLDKAFTDCVFMQFHGNQ